MSELPAEIQPLLQKIKDSAGGSAGREAWSAEVNTLLVGYLTTSVGQLAKELSLARNQMKESSDAASRHQRALVTWTKVLSVATIAYAVAAFLPLFSLVTSPVIGRAWLMWSTTAPANAPPPSPVIFGSYDSMGDCIRRLDAEEQLARQAFAAMSFPVARDPKTKLVTPLPPFTAHAFDNGYREFICLPDTIDPRGPRVK